jgi:hypothetical protein
MEPDFTPQRRQAHALLDNGGRLPSPYRAAKFHRARPDQQIRRGDSDTLGLALAVNLSGAQGN